MAFGKVKKWDSVKKFGFLTPQEGGKDLFFHISELPAGQSVQVGEIVTYEVGRDRQGELLRSILTTAISQKRELLPKRVLQENQTRERL